MTGAGRHAAGSAPSEPSERQGRHAAALPIDAVDGYVPSSFTAPTVTLPSALSRTAPESSSRRSTSRTAHIGRANPPADTGMAALAVRPRSATAESRSSFERAPRRAVPSPAAVPRRTQQTADRRTRQQRTAATYAVAVLGVVTTGAILLPGQQAAAGAGVVPLRTATPTTRIDTASPGLRAGQVLGSCRPIGIPVRRSVGPVVRPTIGATPAPSQPAHTVPVPGLGDAPRPQPTPSPTPTPTAGPTAAPTPVPRRSERDLNGQLNSHRRTHPTSPVFPSSPANPSTQPAPVASLGPAPTATPTPTPTAAPAPTASADPTPTRTPSPPTSTPTGTPVPRPAPTHSATPTPSPTANPIPAAPLRTLVRHVSPSATLRLGTGAFRFSNFTDDLLGVSLGGAGIHGDGTARTILEMTPHSSTKGSHASRAKGSTNQLSLMRVGGSPNLSDFTLLGTKQGHLYNGLRLSKTHDARLTNVRVKAIPGDDHVNPGETFGINDFRTSGTVYDGVEVDGSGVGATGIGTNMSKDVTIVDSYLHDNPHSAGAAFWETHGITLKHVISTDNKTGLNFERTSGSVLIDRPVFHGNKVDLHIGSDRGSTRYTIIDPEYSGSKLRIMLQPHYMGSHNDQKRSDIRVLVHGVDRTDQVVQWVG
ncbi:hypothetical protein [uncultured Amnibacterium sp.]|uniref:hypothetical protein n=1 Tax=uncultured Amnibacterium sp. TaxID=1631851 RepID=UPI0035CAACA0